VPTISLDSFIETHPLPDVVKLDIEGAEGMALRGARQMLSRTRPVFLIEFHGPECVRAVDEVLSDFGYSYRDYAGNHRSVEQMAPRRQYVAESR
jgi:hypothetical protein